MATQEVLDRVALEAVRFEDRRYLLLEEGDLLGRLFVAHLGQAEAHGEDIFYRHADISGAKTLIAFEQQAPSHQQHHGETDLQHQQSLAQPRPRGSTAVRTR